MAWLMFVLMSPWRVIGLCAILFFVAMIVERAATFRFVENNEITNHFGAKEDNDVEV